MTEALIRAGADVYLRDKDGDAALHIAVRAGNFENTRSLLDQGVHINARNGAGLTPLAILAASDESNEAITSLLLAKGAEITSMEQRRKR